MVDDGNGDSPVESVEEPSLDELSQVRVNINEDQQNLQNMIQSIQQKYGPMVEKLETIEEADIDMSDEKQDFLTGTLEQARNLLRQVGGAQ